MCHIRTFIVEDSPVILDSLVSALEDLTQIEVVGTAVDENTAVGWIRNAETNCDLVIIDIFLKSGSGLGVLQAVNQMACPMRKIMLTNYATVEMRKRCIELGADRVFDKSGELDLLISYCGRISGGTATALGLLS
jgi:DNA-binding NarL/FixJ family response regulator